VGSSGSGRSSAAVSVDAPGCWSALAGELGPERPGLADQGSQARPPSEQVIDLPHEGSGTRDVGEREVGAGELDPGLQGEVEERIGQYRPQTLSHDELLACCRDISQVQSGQGGGVGSRE